MVTYNGVDDKFGSDPSEDIEIKVRQKFDLPERYLFFLGNAAPKKNMKGMLRAYNLYVSYADAEPIPMVVAETTSDHLQQMLKHLDLLHLQDYIQPVGYVDHQYLPVIYHLAEVFMYPSLRESFGIPPLEAMACGTPVITSNTSSLPEVVGDAALLIDPKNPADISNAIEIMTENEHFRKVYINRGIQRAGKFTWASTAQDTLKIYKGQSSPPQFSLPPASIP